MGTQKNVQYHWKIRIKQLNSDWNIIIGLMDTRFVEKYQNEKNNNNENKDYFAKHPNGYGVDKNGNLKTNGQSNGKYCQPMKENDVVDVYFDMKQYALWYGVNGIDFGVAYQVSSKYASYKLAIALFGDRHCLEIINCDVVRYDEYDNFMPHNKSDIV